MGSREGRRSRLLLGGGLVAVFAISAISDLRLLAAAAAAAALLFRRGLLGNARRVFRAVVPVTAALSTASAVCFSWRR